MSLLAASTSNVYPSLNLSVFEGPLDLLLHLIREHKVEITDIPIVQITDQYLAHLRQMEEMNLAVAGEFVVMAATLIEIKSRALLPKVPKLEIDDLEDEDPERLLIQRLLDYQKYKALVSTLEGFEANRRCLLFRGEADYGGQYELPIAFGSATGEALAQAFRRVVDRLDIDDTSGVTSVRRQKMTLKISMVSVLHAVRSAGEAGISLEECFPKPHILIEIVMTFLSVLELLRQRKITAIQDVWLNTISLFAQHIELADDAETRPLQESE